MSSSSSSSNPLTNSFDSKKKQKDDQKKRQAGELAPNVDVENGKIINPHNPEFITKVPWYLGNNNGPTLTHHNVQKQDHYLTLNETEQLIQLKNQQKSIFTSNKPQSFQKGACKNCGSLSHKEKDCIERPRSAKSSAWKTGVASSSSIGKDISLKLEDHGKVSYDAKRDYWKGYDPKQYNEVIEQFELVENERRRVKMEELEQQRRMKEDRKKEKELAKKLSKGKTKKDKVKVDSDSDGHDKTTDSGSDDNDSNSNNDNSDSDSDSDVDSDEEDDRFDEEDVDVKKDFINRDENARDFQYQFGRQGGVGGNEFKLTSRNLRIREDTPKYLRNLALDSAFYDPKSRSMRANPYPDANPEDLVYAGDNFLRQSGDALKLASTQVLCWEMQSGNLGATNEDGQMVDVITNPSQAELLQKQFLEKKKALNESKKRAILEKYGNTNNNTTNINDNSLSNTTTATAIAATNVPSNTELDIRLRLGQTEAYVEYSRDGKVIKGVGSTTFKPSKLSKYEEDVYINNHTSVWGSYYHRGQRAWGYACCHSLVKNSYCVGSKGIQANDTASNTITGNLDQQQARRMLESATTTTNTTTSSSSGVVGSTKGNVVKRSDIYGESNLDPTIQLDKDKLQQAIFTMKQHQKTIGKESDSNSSNNISSSSSSSSSSTMITATSSNDKDDMNTTTRNKKRVGYNSMKGVDVSVEDMEAYRMTKIRRDDPMEKFMSDNIEDE